MDCTCDNDRVQCIYERQYAEMSSSSGVLGEDILSFGNESELAPQRAVFGCENVETGDLYSQHADGIMGLGRGDLSVVDQLVDRDYERTHCTKRIPGPDLNYNDICFSGAGSDVSQLSNTFPVFDMGFADRQMLSLSPENYLFRHSKVHGAYCLGVFQNGKDPTTLLGGIIVHNTLVMYDREHEKIGFWKTNCSELWERLQIAGAPPSVPSTFDGTNSTADVSPTVTPTRSPKHDFPGQFKVGLVTFYMSLSVNYSDLKPHIKEIAQFIAQELDVNTSQVHLLNFTAKGNDSLIRWAILPAESAEYLCHCNGYYCTAS